MKLHMEENVYLRIKCSVHFKWEISKQSIGNGPKWTAYININFMVPLLMGQAAD